MLRFISLSVESDRIRASIVEPISLEIGLLPIFLMLESSFESFDFNISEVICNNVNLKIIFNCLKINNFCRECVITFLCISSALNFSNFSLSAIPIAVFDDICLFGVGFLGLNEPEAFLGNWELVCFLVSID